jgi:hypothetical protein
MSQNEGQTKTIDGDTYRVMLLDPFVATDMLADLGEVLGPSLAALASSLGGEDQIKAIVDGTGSEALSFGVTLERAVTEFFKRFSKAKQREVINTLAKVTTVVKGVGEEPSLERVFAVHFRGRIGALYQWLGFALQVQFQDFFSSLAPGIRAAVLRAGLLK